MKDQEVDNFDLQMNRSVLFCLIGCSFAPSLSQRKRYGQKWNASCPKYCWQGVAILDDSLGISDRISDGSRTMVIFRIVTPTPSSRRAGCGDMSSVSMEASVLSRASRIIGSPSWKDRTKPMQPERGLVA